LTEKALTSLYERRRKINIAKHVHPGTDVESIMVFWHMPQVQQIYAQLKERYEHPLRKNENALSVQRALAVFRAEDYIAQGQYGYAYRELLKCLPYTDVADLAVLLPLMKICAEKKKKTDDLWYIDRALQIQMSAAKSELCRLVETYRKYPSELRETVLGNGCIDPDREIAEDPKMQAVWDIHETYPYVKKIYFCETKETVYKLLTVFQAKSVSATALVGKKGKLGLTERVQYEHLKKFRDTEVQVAVSTKEMAGEGMDIPGLAITVLTSPTTSPQMSKQTDGRVRKPVLINGEEIAANIVLRTAVYEDSAYYLGQCRVKQMEQDNL
jgi:ERCC4-related helicase